MSNSSKRKSKQDLIKSIALVLRGIIAVGTLLIPLVGVPMVLIDVVAKRPYIGRELRVLGRVHNLSGLKSILVEPFSLKIAILLLTCIGIVF